MIDTKTAPYAALLLRVITGALFIQHGLLKVLVFTPAGTAGYFGSIGLPSWLAYLVIALEILGGAALILGIATRLLSLLFIPVLLGAAIFGHWANGFGWSNAGGGWEYPVMWAGVQAALVLLGDGVYALYPLPKK